MALEYGFFDSEIEGYDTEGMPIFDRAKTSDFFAEILSNLISSGVLAEPNTCFQVTAGSGMTINIAPGMGYIQGRYARDESSESLTLDSAPSSGSRIDMIVLRANYPARDCEIIVKTGTAAASPKEPELIQPESGGDYYELCLATIAVGTNVSSISQSNITDTRFLKPYCGAVAQLIDGIDISAIFSQMKAQFDEWFEEMKGQLSTDAAGNLQLEIDKINGRLQYGSSLPTTGENGDIFFLIE